MNLLYARPGKWSKFLPLLPFIAILTGYYYFSVVYVPEDETSYRQIVPKMGEIGKAAIKLLVKPKEVKVSEDVTTYEYSILGMKLFITDVHTEPTLIADTLVSLRRIALTLGSLFVLTVLGLTMGLFRHLEKLWLSFVTFFDKINVTMILVIFIMIFGGDERAKIIFMIIGLVFSVTLDVYNRTKSVPREQIVSALTLGANSAQVTVMVFFQILPQIISTFLVFLKSILMLLVLAEFMGADSGIGYRVAVFRRGLVMENIFVYVLWTALLTYGLDFLGRSLLRRFRWFEK